MYDQSCEAYEYGLEIGKTRLSVIEAVKDLPSNKACVDGAYSDTTSVNKKLSEGDQVLSPATKKLVLIRSNHFSIATDVFGNLQRLDGKPETAKCKDFGKYLANREAFLSSIGALPRPEMVVEETASIALCKDIEPSVAAVAADNSFVNAKWNSALKYSSIACEGGAFDGCAIASRILTHHWQGTEEYRDALAKKESVKLNV